MTQFRVGGTRLGVNGERPRMLATGRVILGFGILALAILATAFDRLAYGQAVIAERDVRDGESVFDSIPADGGLVIVAKD